MVRPWFARIAVLALGVRVRRMRDRPYADRGTGVHAGV